MLETVLKQIYHAIPLLEKVDREFGNLSLMDYLSSMKPISCGSIDDRRDLASAAKDYLSSFFDSEITNQVTRTLNRIDFLLTANHHQIDFSLDLIHGNLLYEYLLESQGKAYQSIIPVISVSSITMTNDTYPKGMVLYDTRADGLIRIPVISNKYRQSSSLMVKPFTDEMISRTQKQIRKYLSIGSLSSEETAAASRILDEVYGNEIVLRQDSYSKQVTYANILLSEKFYSDRQSRYVYIPMEEITSRLIIKDLNNEKSFLYRLLWNKKILKKLLTRLDGVTGCWSANGDGTHLFWGIDAKGRKIHLRFNQDLTELYGVDMDGRQYVYDYSLGFMEKYLKEKKLIPGLFTAFTTIGFARDYSLFGGCFQSIYLEQMVQGIIETISEDKLFEREMTVLKKKKFYFLSGLVTDLYIKDNRAVPAGPVEMWTEPALFAGFENRLRLLTVKQAIEYASVIMYTKKIPVSMREKNWYSLILRDLFKKWKETDCLSGRSGR